MERDLWHSPWIYVWCYYEALNQLNDKQWIFSQDPGASLEPKTDINEQEVSALITVKVRTILTLKKILGKGEVEISMPERSTLGALLTMMVNRWGDELASQLFETKGTRVLPHIRLMVNGRDIAFLNRMETVLQNGDEVLILPPVSGG